MSFAKRLILCTAIASVMTGCAQQNATLRDQMAAGDLGHARAALLSKPITDKKQRGYMLQRMRMLVATVSDGYAYPQDQTAQEIFDTLRKQGINKDRTILAAFTIDGATFWKGEPFEQALAYHYIGAHFAQMGDWANVRAAAIGSLFPLKSFGKDDKGNDLKTEEIAQKIQGDSEEKITGYVVEPTDFALGYLMNGLANQQLAGSTGDRARMDEASDNFAEAIKLNPALSGVCDTLKRGDFNTVLLVDFGTGPHKYGRGPDQAIADFEPLAFSDTRGLDVSINNQPMLPVPIACDVNTMAQNHRWKNLEDVRIAKSYIGSALLVGGAGVGAYGAASGNQNAGYIGLAMMLAGAVAKASAHANVEYCEVLPQRIYLVPLKILAPQSSIRLQISGVDTTRMVLPDISPPVSKAAQLRVVRLIGNVPPPTQMARR